MIKAILRFVNKIQNDHVAAYAGQAALFFILSMIPLLLIVLSVVKLTPITEDMLLYWLDLFAPRTVLDLLRRIVREVYHYNVGTLVFSIAAAIFSSAKTIQSLQYSLNIVYEIKETRNWFKLRFHAIIETLVFVVAVFVVMALMVFGRRFQNLLTEYQPNIAKITRYIFGMRVGLMFGVLILVLTWIYMVLPNRKASFKSQLVGGTVCATLWYILSGIVYAYNTLFDGFSLYGSLTTIVIMMFWLYYAMFIFLVCGEINNQFEILWSTYMKSRERRKEKHRARAEARQEAEATAAKKDDKPAPDPEQPAPRQE